MSQPRRGTPPHPSSTESEGYLIGRWFTGARRAGFLSLLAPDVWHTLSGILSFTSRDGRRSFTVDQLGMALGLSRDEARVRLEALTQTTWQDAPLAEIETDTFGDVAGARLAPVEQLTRVQTPERDSTAAPSALGVPAGNAASQALRQELTDTGLLPTQADWLLRSFPESRIRQQLDWLPQRAARNPAAMLVRAITENWDPPKERG